MAARQWMVTRPHAYRSLFSCDIGKSVVTCLCALVVVGRLGRNQIFNAVHVRQEVVELTMLAT